MDDSSFSLAASAVFKKLVKAVDAADPDVVEADSTGDMVTIIATKSGEKVVVNTQRAVQQIWVAGKGAGIHFTFSDERAQWLDDKGKGIELMSWVADCVETASGERLVF